MFRIFLAIGLLSCVGAYANEALYNMDEVKVEVVKLSHKDPHRTVSKLALESMIRRELVDYGIAMSQSEGTPVLHCQIISLPLMYEEDAAPAGYAYSVELRVEEFDELERNRGVMTMVSAWGTHMLHVTTSDLYPDSLRESIRELLHRFIKDYKAANP